MTGIVVDASVALGWCFPQRYESICKILKAKYGDRVRDLVPTEASELWL